MTKQFVGLLAATTVFAFGIPNGQASDSKGSDAKGSHAKMHKSDTYVVDNTHASIGFKISHLVISKVAGGFNDYEASLDVDGDHLHGASATIKVASIDTNNDKRDGHLRSPDFFDAEKFPEITFTATTIQSRTMTGDLTIKGITKAVALSYELKGPIRDPYGNTKVGFTATGTINRQDFGLTWSKALESGGLVVGDEVELHIDVEAAKQ